MKPDSRGSREFAAKQQLLSDVRKQSVATNEILSMRRTCYRHSLFRTQYRIHEKSGVLEVSGIRHIALVSE